ncbi:hypothetical protein BH11PLA1_BH11PLA1_10430 [soil metagenome]
MKRRQWLSVAIVCLTLGTATACALTVWMITWSEPTFRTSSQQARSRYRDAFPHRDGFEVTITLIDMGWKTSEIIETRDRGPGFEKKFPGPGGVERIRERIRRVYSDDITVQTAQVDAYGWPLRCVAIAAPELGESLLEGWPNQAWQPLPWMSQLQLPTSFFVGNLTMNAAAFGVAWFFAILGTVHLYRWRRHRRGACLYCGYAMTNLEQCPECGARLNPPSSPA